MVGMCAGGWCFFWYRPSRVVQDKGPLNGCVFCVVQIEQSVQSTRAAMSGQ